MYTPQEQLIDAAKDLFMQAYGNQQYGSHPPTRAQWLMLGGALKEMGVALPEDYPDVFSGRYAFSEREFDKED